MRAWLAFAAANDGAHHHARAVDGGAQFLAVGVHVGDGTRRHARIHRGLRHGRRDLDDEARIERLRNQILRTEFERVTFVGLRHFVALIGLFSQFRDGAHARQLHLFGDGRGAHVQRAAEDEREAQHVVDLVRIVRTARRDDRVRAHLLRFFGADFRLGVRERENQRLVRHVLDHLRLQHTGARTAEEHVGRLDGVGQCARVRSGRVARLRRVEVAAPFVDHALRVRHQHVLLRKTELHEQVQARNGRRTRARAHQLHFVELLAYHLEPVQDRGGRDDGRAVLVIVEDGNLHALAQLLLDVEALGRLDVFEVDAAQRRFQHRDGLDELVRIGLGKFDVEHVDAGELLEEAALAFHHRLRGERSDVAETQHGRAVRDHAHQIAARGVLLRVERIGVDRLARGRDTRRVREREVQLVGQRLRRRDGDLAGLRILVVCESALLQLFVHV